MIYTLLLQLILLISISQKREYCEETLGPLRQRTPIRFPQKRCTAREINLDGRIMRTQGSLMQPLPLPWDPQDSLRH